MEKGSISASSGKNFLHEYCLRKNKMAKFHYCNIHGVVDDSVFKVQPWMIQKGRYWFETRIRRICPPNIIIEEQPATLNPGTAGKC